MKDENQDLNKAIDFIFGKTENQVGLTDETTKLIQESVVDAIQSHTQEKLDELVSARTDAFINSQINAMLPALLDEKLERIKTLPRQIEIVHKDEKGDTLKVHKIAHYHQDWEELFEDVRAGVNVALVGPAGGGKTKAAQMVAEALGIKFYPQTFGPQTTQSQILGYNDANGKYVRTPIRDAYEHGGLFLGDEFDAGSGAVAVCMNSITANDVAGFPDGEVKRNDDFRIIVNMNTFGRGADVLYVGRNELDGATLNRFSFMPWDYDESLERIIANHDEWVTHVQAIRSAVNFLEIRHIVSPRASIMGAIMLRRASKFDSWERVEFKTIWQGLNSIEIQRIRQRLDDVGYVQPSH